MNVGPNHPKPDNPEGDPVSPPTPIVYESEEYRWEYKQIKLDLARKEPLDQTRLNELGNEGWELAAVFTHDKTAHYYFKRTAETT